MSSKDDFFKKVEENNKQRQDFKESFYQELQEFQEKTQLLISEIQSWFEGSTITSTVDRRSIADSIEPGKVNSVAALTLKNGDKVLTIEPEGLRFLGGITGSLKVKIINMSRSPNTQTFNIHMRDAAPRSQGVATDYQGWVIVTGSNSGRVVEEFNQDKFFEIIESFS